MVLFRHNLPQPTQAQLMSGEFPETLSQSVYYSFLKGLGELQIQKNSRGSELFISPSSGQGIIFPYVQAARLEPSVAR